MSKQQQILAQAKSGREPKSPQIYRRGRVTNSSAYYRGARPDVEAGKDQKVVADFLGAISKPLAQAMGQKVEEFAQAERDAGIAHFMNATPEQRAKMRTAIKMGYITESQSPYFREGVSIAYTKNLLGKYNQDLFLEYEDWKSKNDVSSGSFDEFLDNFDSKFSPNFETIHDSVLVEHFVPGQMGVRRQLQQMHTGRLAEDFRQQAEYQKNGELFGIFKSYSDGVYADLLKSDTPLGEELRNQESSNFKFGKNQEQMIKALKDKNITPATRKYFESSEYGRNFLESWDKLSEKKKPEVKSKPKETKEKGVIVPESGNYYDLNIKDFYSLEPSSSTEQMKTGSKVEEASNYNDILKKRLPEHYKEMTKSSKNRREFVEYMEEVNGYPANNIPKGVNIKFDPVHFAQWLKNKKR